MSKRIAVISTDRKSGGIQAAISMYLRSLARLGWDVDLILMAEAPVFREAAGDRASFANTAFHALSPIEAFAMRRLAYVPRRIRQILEGCEVVLNSNNFLCRPLRKIGRPLVTISHSDKWKGAEDADAVICLSMAALESAVRAGLARERLVHLPHNYTPKAAANDYGGRDEAPFVVATAGRFVKRKGFDDFIRAAAALRGSCEDTVFWLAGNGEEEASLRRLCADTNAGVVFKGWMDMGELARQSHVFCVTSREESFGFALCEMMDAGIPCIASRTNGPSDLLDGGKAGLLYDIGDWQTLARHIAALHASRSMRLDMSARAFARIREASFSAGTFDARLAELLSKTTAGRSSTPAGRPR